MKGYQYILVFLGLFTISYFISGLLATGFERGLIGGIVYFLLCVITFYFYQRKSSNHDKKQSKHGGALESKEEKE